MVPNKGKIASFSGDSNEDPTGRIYQKLIPPQQRHDLGQYYTPPEIIKVICSWCVKDANDVVLDPACGNGGFLLEAYDVLNKLISLKNLNDANKHIKILSQVYGIDVNHFPAQLAASNLASKSPLTQNTKANIFITDFFDIIGKEGLPTQFDAIIGNPPYIRHELLSNKKRFRNHLTESEQKTISHKSDIYVYFLTLASKVLQQSSQRKSGGRLGFLISERWQYNEYGAGFQQFLLKNFSINAIMVFDRHAFEDALIETSVLLLTQENDTAKRNENRVKLIRLKEKMDQ